MGSGAPRLRIAAGPDGRDRVGYGGKLVDIAVGRQAAKNEKTAVRHYDIPLLKQAIVHGYVGGDALGLGGIRGLAFDTTRLRCMSDAGSDYDRHQGDREQELHSAHE